MILRFFSCRYTSAFVFSQKNAALSYTRYQVPDSEIIARLDTNAFLVLVGKGTFLFSKDTFSSKYVAALALPSRRQRDLTSPTSPTHDKLWCYIWWTDKKIILLITGPKNHQLGGPATTNCQHVVREGSRSMRLTT